MAHSDTKRPGISALPLRHTDIDGRLRLLREAGLVKGDVETGLRLMGERTLLEATELMDPPVENVIGAIPYQLGLATNFRINGHEVLVPMAVREPTIIAGVSKAAKLALPEGFSVDVGPFNEMTAEILFRGFGSEAEAEEAHELVRSGLGYAVHKTEGSPAARGRITGYDVLYIAPERTSDCPLIVVRIKVDTGDFMGARISTTMAQKLAKHLEGPAGREATTVICSNHKAGRMISVKAILPRANVDRETARTIIDLQRWATKDPYREITHNKGIMNAVMAVCRATGQDEEAAWTAMWLTPRPSPVWRQSFTRCSETRDGLLMQLYLKVPIATRGGATQDPFSKMIRGIADITDVRDLLQTIGAAGLAANIAALHCLANEGILAAFEKVRTD
ncbi:MAG: hypothetical protein U9Q03_02690 [Patescibacteria group bacterium]|nr:hypothetical protein [Patescibacteria group bacterium]